MMFGGATAASAQANDSLRLYYVGRPVGWETYGLDSTSTGRTLTADLDYIDRGRRNHVQSTTMMSATYAPLHLEASRVSDTVRTLVTRVDVSGSHATVTRNGATSQVDLPARAFAIAPYTPVSQHLALLRYWMSHGAPASIAVVPGGPTNAVAIKRQGVDTVTVGGRHLALTRYSIDGVVWGTEYAWLDPKGRLAMFASAAGGLSFKAVAASLVPSYPALMGIATRAAIKDLASISARTHSTSEGKIALIGATVVDGTGHDAIPEATIVMDNGRIIAVGPSAVTKIPAGAKKIDVHGKTIVPGLWDMHAHLHQLEWLPVYIAGGITTVRDMGNETPFILGLRKAQTSGQVRGPRIVAAGLVDGGGVNAFGAESATTPDEGRQIVRNYHALGFEQMKLYSLLSPAVVSAICDEAHKLGMTVTGHIPNSLSLLAAVDSGMDQVAHQPVRGDPQADSTKRVIEHLRARGTIIDPTVSWAEIGGHSTAEPLQSFQPVTEHLPAVFMQTRVAGWGSATVDTATAHQRLARQLATIAALYNAGVPIVAGTDEGVPAFSVYREVELYVKAGMSPMDAIRSATAVPAKAMRLDKEVGTLETGKRADLLVLDANPLADIANLRTVRWVIQGGKMYESAALWRAAGFTP